MEKWRCAFVKEVEVDTGLMLVELQETGKWNFPWESGGMPVGL